jgi:hypothetical protein
MLALKAFIAGALILATSAYAQGGDSTVIVTVTNTSSASKTFSYTYGEGSESTSYTIVAGASVSPHHWFFCTCTAHTCFAVHFNETPTLT